MHFRKLAAVVLPPRVSPAPFHNIGFGMSSFSPNCAVFSCSFRQQLGAVLDLTPESLTWVTQTAMWSWTCILWEASLRPLPPLEDTSWYSSPPPPHTTPALPSPTLMLCHHPLPHFPPSTSENLFIISPPFAHLTTLKQCFPHTPPRPLSPPNTTPLLLIVRPSYFALQAPATQASPSQNQQQQSQVQQQQQQQQGNGQQATGSLQAAEQAGTLSGVQNLQTKGGGEETVRPAGQAHGHSSQEVRLPAMCVASGNQDNGWSCGGLCCHSWRVPSFVWSCLVCLDMACHVMLDLMDI